MSYAHVDVENIETTKSEKLLAVVLAVFLLVGGIWTYQRLDDTVAEALAPSIVSLSPSEQGAIERLGRTRERLGSAESQVVRTRITLVDRREAYNTALNAGEPAGELRTAYRRAQTDYANAQEARASARAAVRSAEPAALEAERHRAQLERDRFDRHELAAFFARLAFVVLAVAAAYFLLGFLRKRASRYLPLALAAVGASALLALVMGGDYVTDYVDPLSVGPLLLSLAGAALTLLAFLGLQRYLARRIPIRRVRKGECPFCGYPVRDGEHCAGCGRSVMADCTTCHQPRRVGTAFCSSCGQT
jgi:lipopolysaccharide export LptBFGC system permease protein LptF